MDIEEFRKHFPILNRKINKRKLIYLDNAATTQKPVEVIDSIKEFYENHNANIHRGIHTLSDESTEMYESAREKVRKFLNLGNKYDIVFTKNATEAINLVAYSLSKQTGKEQSSENIHNDHKNALKSSSTAVSSYIEHHANFIPWQQNFRFKILDVDENGFTNLDVIEGAKITAVTMASNVTGNKLNYKDVVERAKKEGSLVLLDGSQSIPHFDNDIYKADFLAFSAHKMMGPTGLGVLAIRKDVLEEPFLYGGEMINEVSFYDTTWAKMPYRFEAGTMPIAEAVSFSKAIDFLEEHKSFMIKHEKELLGVFSDLIEDSNLETIRLNTEGYPIFSFLTKMHHNDAAMLLDSKGIAVRSGNHCAQPYMKYKKITGTLRASAYYYNTEDEIRTFIDELKKMIS